MTNIGANYAQALYSLAKEENRTEAVLAQLETLNEAFSGEPDFVRLLVSPNVSKQERCAIVDKSFRGKLHPYVLNFLMLLTEKGYARHFGDCCKAYREQYDADNGIVSVLAVTVVALTPTQSEKLTAKLEGAIGKTVRLRNRVDPNCLGGVRLDYDGKRLDGTVRNRLDSIGAMLKNTVL